MDNFTKEILVFPALETDGPIAQTNTDANYPYIAIGTLPTEVFEDEQVQLISEIELQEGDIYDYTSFSESPSKPRGTP